MDPPKKMDRWHSVAEEKIREAMEAGHFRRLRGYGRPQKLEPNPFEPADLRTAHLVLEGAGMSPAWIEERKDLDRDIDAAMSKLARSAAAGQGELAAREFRQSALELNKRILTYNLRVPSGGFQRPQVDIEFEISRARNSHLPSP